MNSVLMTVEFIEEFFKRCLEKEAVTREERLSILEGLIKEKKATPITLAPALYRPLKKFFDKTKGKKMLFVKRKETNL